MKVSKNVPSSLTIQIINQISLEDVIFTMPSGKAGENTNKESVVLAGAEHNEFVSAKITVDTKVDRKESGCLGCILM